MSSDAIDPTAFFHFYDVVSRPAVKLKLLPKNEQDSKKMKEEAASMKYVKT